MFTFTQHQIQVDTVCQGCAVNNIDNIGQSIGDADQVPFLGSGNELAYLLFKQRDAQPGQVMIDYRARRFADRQVKRPVKLAHRSSYINGAVR